MSRIVAARIVSLGRGGRQCSAAVARSWDIELTFETGESHRLKAGFKVRSLAVRSLAALLAEARASGLDARPMVRATISPVLRLVSGGAQ